MQTARQPRFNALADVPLTQPMRILETLCDHFTEHGTVTLNRRTARIETDFGVAVLEAGESLLRIRAEGDDETSFAYVKLSVAEHLLAFADGESPKIVWTGDGAAGARLPYFREMTVVAARNVTPHMRRITLAGENLQRFEHGGFHIRLLFPAGDTPEMAWPVTGQDGRPSWPEGVERPKMRVYTIRGIDVSRGIVDIDMVLHEDAGSPGADFAAGAKAGDVVGMAGPGGGSYGEADRYLLAGDETALPAIGRILEELPATAHVTALIEIADRAEEQELRSKARLDLRWLHRDGAAPGTTTLLQDAVMNLDWDAMAGERFFAWAGCEHRAARAIRSFLRKERHLARDRHLAAAYWRRGANADEAHDD